MGNSNDNAEASHDSSASFQYHGKHSVVHNSVQSMDMSREHHHGHLHHDAKVERGQEGEITYSEGTIIEKGTTSLEDQQNHTLHRRNYTNPIKSGSLEIVDTEKADIIPVAAEEDPQSLGFSTIYIRYRVFFHLVIWLVFTG